VKSIFDTKNKIKDSISILGFDFIKKSLQLFMKTFWFYFLLENINNEKTLEINPATSQERIQKNKK